MRQRPADRHLPALDGFAPIPAVRSIQIGGSRRSRRSSCYEDLDSHSKVLSSVRKKASEEGGDARERILSGGRIGFLDHLDIATRGAKGQFVTRQIGPIEW